jgi:hypothetical protein
LDGERNAAARGGLKGVGFRFERLGLGSCRPSHDAQGGAGWDLGCVGMRDRLWYRLWHAIGAGRRRKGALVVTLRNFVLRPWKGEEDKDGRADERGDEEDGDGFFRHKTI